MPKRKPLFAQMAYGNWYYEQCAYGKCPFGNRYCDDCRKCYDQLEAELTESISDPKDGDT
jgi:hypothetical protein